MVLLCEMVVLTYPHFTPVIGKKQEKPASPEPGRASGRKFPLSGPSLRPAAPPYRPVFFHRQEEKPPAPADLVRVLCAMPGGRPQAAPTPSLRRIRRGGLRPPGDPRRDTHRPGGGGIEPLLFPVPPAQAVTAGAGPRWGRKDVGRRRTPHSAPTLKSPFFFGFQKPFLFPAGKKKWVLIRPFRLYTLKTPSVTFGDSSLREGAKRRAESSRPTN